MLLIIYGELHQYEGHPTTTIKSRRTIIGRREPDDRTSRTCTVFKARGTALAKSGCVVRATTVQEHPFAVRVITMGTRIRSAAIHGVTVVVAFGRGSGRLRTLVLRKVATPVTLNFASASRPLTETVRYLTQHWTSANWFLSQGDKTNSGRLIIATLKCINFC